MQHTYTSHVTWHSASGTTDYRAYSRDHKLCCAQKPVLDVSADPAFLGSAERHNPEDFFLASLSSCHMLWYLHLCAESGVVVLSYDDHPTGTLLLEPGGAGEFTTVRLAPRVEIRADSDASRAFELHERAHGYCFIARSVRCAIELKPEIVHADG
ncbi:OsmC family protein [Larsenimonas salina]|uniref:OsmC family protein n=1 Tax=Larsenimonas salina TaxID=1295565 RepID=UPI002072EF95|nr:OsmC family protein [Larsenimonas salina]MCM5703920.1 OsmC family protein [Larsenimonas salina]